MKVQKFDRRLPLWKLEMELEAAQRRFQRTEAEHRASEREVERLRKEIKLRRMENCW